MSHPRARTPARTPHQTITGMRGRLLTGANAHGRLEGGRGGSRLAVGVLLPLIALGAAGCGDRVDESGRAELEARYGPRGPATDTASDAPLDADETAAPSPAVGGLPDERSDSPTTLEPADPAGREPEDSAPVAATPPPKTPLADSTPVDPGSDLAEADAQEFDVAALLAEAEGAYGSLASLRASFVQVMEVPLLERISSGSGTWFQKGRNRFKMDFEDPPDDEIVADGTYLWLYHPSQNPNQVIRSELDAGGTDSGTADLLARILGEARTAYEAHYDGREPLDGTPMHVVSLTPIGRSPYRSVRIWVGTSDRLVRRFQIVEVNESVRTVTLSNLEPNAALEDSLFRFTVPPGADVFSG